MLIITKWTTTAKITHKVFHIKLEAE
jgi:hypothetical protein